MKTLIIQLKKMLMGAYNKSKFYQVFDKVNKLQCQILFLSLHRSSRPLIQSRKSGHEHFNNRLFIINRQ